MKKKPFYFVSLGLTGIVPLDLLVLGRNMVKAMTGNPNFTGAGPLLVRVTDASDALASAIEAFAMNGGHRARYLRDEAFAALKGLVTELGAYVQSQSNGDAAIILSAGCGVRRMPSPLGVLPAPARVAAFVTAFPGTLEVRWGGVRGRTQYRLSICEGDPSDEKNWRVLAYTSKNRFQSDDLQSGVQYYFRVETMSPAGISPVSDVATAKAA